MEQPPISQLTLYFSRNSTRQRHRGHQDPRKQQSRRVRPAAAGQAERETRGRDSIRQLKQ